MPLPKSPYPQTGFCANMDGDFDYPTDEYILQYEAETTINVPNASKLMLNYTISFHNHTDYLFGAAHYIAKSDALLEKMDFTAIDCRDPTNIVMWAELGEFKESASVEFMLVTYYSDFQDFERKNSKLIVNVKRDENAEKVEEAEVDVKTMIDLKAMKKNPHYYFE